MHTNAYAVVPLRARAVPTRAEVTGGAMHFVHTESGPEPFLNVKNNVELIRYSQHTSVCPCINVANSPVTLRSKVRGCNKAQQRWQYVRHQEYEIKFSVNFIR